MTNEQSRTLRQWIERRDASTLAAACLAWDALPCSFAIKQLRSVRSARLELDDLLQEARIGLVDGFRKYDPSKGSFVTFASWQIRGAISHAMRATLYIIRPPSQLRELRIQAKRLCLDNADEIAEVLGVSVQKAREALELFEVIEPSSLTWVNERGRRVTWDVGAPDPAYGRIEAQATISALMPLLHHSERELLERRAAGDTLNDLAIESGVSRQQIMVRERQAFAKVRKVARI